MIYVIIPTLNVSGTVGDLLSELQTAACQLVVSDGLSDDETVSVAIGKGAQIALGYKGRGSQLRRGADLAQSADWLLFLHADTTLPKGWYHTLEDHVGTHPHKAAYFGLRYDHPGLSARIVEAFVRLRNWAWALPYGDQGLFISRDLYDEIGGYRDMPLFEDVDIIERIGRRKLRKLPQSVVSSCEKYKRDGFLRRGWRNFRLLRRYKSGETIDNLLRAYT